MWPAGLAVVWDMLLTTQFLTLVMITVWRVPTPVALCFHLLFSAVEATFFSACAEKVPTGICMRAYLCEEAICNLLPAQANVWCFVGMLVTCLLDSNTTILSTTSL